MKAGGAVTWNMSRSVSIPYRFNEREVWSDCGTGEAKFQFLIGSMKGTSPFAFVFDLFSFQFLIGSMKEKKI